MAIYFCGCAGGLEGADTNFSHQLTQPSDLDKVYVNGVWVWHGRFVDKIGFEWKNPSTGDIFQAEIGGDGGEHHEFFTLSQRDAITGIWGNNGVHIDSVSIEIMDKYTKKTTVHGPFGGSGGSAAFSYQVPLVPKRLPPLRWPSVTIPGLGTVPARTITAPWVDTYIMGLWGNSGDFVESLGVILQRSFRSWYF